MGEKLYRLWYEYLKRSKPFEDFCTASDKERRSVNPSTSVNPIQEKYPKTHLMAMFVSFGNPFEQNFDDWYMEQKQRGERGQNYCAATIARQINFSHYVWLANEILTKSKGVEKPTLREIRDEIDGLHQMKKMFLEIDLRATEGQVIKRVKELFKERKKNETFSKYDRIASQEQGEDVFMSAKTGLITHSTLPAGKIMLDELKRYLEAYDMKAKRKKDNEIYTKLKRPGEKKKDLDEEERIARRWVQNANKIIQNLERVQEFPGTY